MSGTKFLKKRQMLHQSFPRYDCGCRNWKMGHIWIMWPWPRPFGVVCHL